MGDEDETIEALIRPSKPLHRIAIRVVEGRGRGLHADLLHETPISIGQSSDNDLSIDDPMVSRYHAELTLRRSSIEVRDLESTNGTYIDGVRVTRAFVRPSSSLIVGSNTILLATEPNGSPSSQAPGGEVPAIAGLVAESPGMRRVLRELGRLTASNVSVLLYGETGTGKEVLARALHELSGRSRGPFEVVDCGSLAPTLIASELFGHERGAFTGAVQQHVGAFERAHGGTLLLDEIGELPLELQPMLLGVLERRQIRRVGGSRDRAVDVRVIAATHRDLRGATNRGTFRADLYFRLAVARVVVPPLRERPEDVAPLVRHFAERLTGEPYSQPFDSHTLETLEKLPWSGNVRELRNMVESAIVLGPLAPAGTVASAPPPPVSPPQDDELFGLPYRDARTLAVTSFEYSYLSRLYEECNGNVSKAARLARMDRHYLLGLLRKHGLR